MSKFEDKIMKQIEDKKIKPLPKSFFALTKAFLETCLFALALGVIYIINLSFYLPRRGMGRGGMGPNRIDFIISSIPWSFVAIGLLGLGLIIWLVYRYTGAYKTKLLFIIGGISLVILLSGFFLSLSNINEHFERRREFRHFYPENRGEQMMPRRDMPRYRAQ